MEHNSRQNVWEIRLIMRTTVATLWIRQSVEEGQSREKNREVTSWSYFGHHVGGCDVRTARETCGTKA
jgi:hypothetical protein